MRRPFTFGLQAVLEHRKLEEDAAVRELAARTQAYDAALAERDKLRKARRDAASALPKTARVRVADVQVHAAHVQFLDAAGAAQNIAIAHRCEEREAARQNLAAARRHHKVVETLRDRQMAAFAAADRRAEETELEDRNALLTALRMMAGG
jgi:flagellar export protein FliJ